MIKLAPSLLSANFANLQKDIEKAEQAGAHYLHLDVMDGHFVPNISFGAPVIKSIRSVSNMCFDVHLMIDYPLRYAEAFAKSGADIINFHVESKDDPQSVISKIKSLGKKVGITIKPATDEKEILKFLHDIDLVLVMSVEPGFGGAKLIRETLKKAERIADYINRESLHTEIEMDGGIYLDNVSDVIYSGVNVIVAGTAVFGAADISEAVRSFYKTFNNG